ncbi:CpsH domain protein [Bacillus cereus Rock3-44]|nr:CpsH domain protein [Bacillus cereus Rock3-44]
MIFAFLIVLQVFRTFMEWKYDKESKEYVISFLGVICLTISFSVVMYLF